MKIELLILGILMMIDYALTVYGIKIGAVIEWNPFMSGFFDLPVFVSALLRMVMVTGLLTLIFIGWKRNPKTYAFALKLGIIFNIVLLINHISWITEYAKLST